MNAIPLWTVALAFSVCLAAQPAGALDPEQRLFVVQVFTLPKAEGLALLAQDLNDRQLHDQLDEKAKGTPAVLEKILLVASNNTDKVDLQQADELIYPTEFDPQQLPSQLAIGEAGLVEALSKFFQPPAPAPAPTPPAPDLKSAEARGAGESKAQSVPPRETAQGRHPVNSGLSIITSITPTAFESRALGERLTLSPLFNAPSGEIDLEAEFQSTSFRGYVTFNGEQQPQFRNRKITTRLTCRVNAPALLGSFTAVARTGTEFETKDETLSLAFLTARMPTPHAPGAGAVIKPGADMNATLEVFSLPKEEAVPLLAEAINEAGFHARIKAAVAAGLGKQEALISRRIRHGTEETMEEADEFIYPIEFDPPQVPSNLLIADDGLLADLRAGRQVGTGAAPSAANPHNGGFGLMTAATPTAFEMRKLGTKLTILAGADTEGRKVTMTLRAELTRRIGERRYAGITQPLFESRWLSTSTRATLGIPHLIGTMNRPLNSGIEGGNKEDRLWFAFVTIRKA